MATICALCETFDEHAHHGIMPGNMLLLHIYMRASKQLAWQNVTCTIISLAPWQWAS